MFEGMVVTIVLAFRTPVDCDIIQKKDSEVPLKRGWTCVRLIWGP